MATKSVGKMDFINETKFAAGWTVGFEPDGRELLVIAIKATFELPHDQGGAKLAKEQLKLTAADEFEDQPGLSAPLYETDYAHRKPFCDVLVNGSAYAPRGKKERRVTVSIKVGSMMKSFVVTGNRVWKKHIWGVRPGQPELFDMMPISYRNAFGGIDNTHNEPSKVKTFLENPVGLGYYHYKKNIDGQPMPNTEEIRRPIKDPRGKYRPMALGPIGRNWQSRYPLAGTYDQAWINTRAPFWPDNFDYRYFQAAPPDQQINYPQGGEDVVLKNLTPAGLRTFKLPKLSMPVLFVPHAGKERTVKAVIDTVLIEPDLERFFMTWRVSLPMRRNCFDMKQVIAGEMPKAWHRARRSSGKTHYKGLADLIRSRQRAKSDGAAKA